MKRIGTTDLDRIALNSMVKTFTAGELNALADYYGSKHGQSAMQKFGAYLEIVQLELLKRCSSLLSSSRRLISSSLQTGAR